MKDKGPLSKVLIVLSPAGKLREVQVDAPVLVLEELTEKAVSLAKRLATEGNQKEDDDDRST